MILPEAVRLPAVRGAALSCLAVLSVLATSTALGVIVPADAADNGVPTVLASTVVVETSAGAGAGFVVAADTVMTAAHVVAGARTVTVRLGSGAVPGTVTRSDADDNLALVTAHVVVPPLSFVTAEPNVGSTVFAVGNPLGEGISVSRGIVSGAHQVKGHREVQTDAAINPGNSGGPLVTEQGEVVGVVLSKLRNAEGIALAVSAADAHAFLTNTSAGTTGAPSPVPAPPAASRGAGTSTRLLITLSVLVALCAAYAFTRRRRVTKAPDIEVVLHPLPSSTSSSP